MKAPNGPIILIVFCALVFALSYITIGAITTPTRAITSGIALAAATGVFIWFAATNRFAIARGLIAVGSTAIATPLAAVQAVSNDFLFSVLDETDEIGQRAINYENTLDMILTLMGIGACVGIALIVIGGLMHRMPKP